MLLRATENAVAGHIWPAIFPTLNQTILLVKRSWLKWWRDEYNA